MAGLKKCSDFLQPRQLTHIYLQKLNPKEVAVSKLCCPACWEYFDILSGNDRQEGKDTYKIRGRHSTVFPVQLPSWSSPDVVQELIKRFDKYIGDELSTMWRKHVLKEEESSISKALDLGRKSGHSHHPSLQSVSSAITDASVQSGGTNLSDLEYIQHYLPEADDRENL